MANMSYCRFENTANDLDDCAEYLTDELEPGSHEHSARKRMVRTMLRMMEELGIDYTIPEGLAPTYLNREDF